MKTLFSLLLFSFMTTTATAVEYAPNNGFEPPGTFTSETHANEKSKKIAAPTTSESGLSNSADVTTDDMNTSPNKAPLTDEEALENTTLSRKKGFDPGGAEKIEAQEEDALDYSTTPEEEKHGLDFGTPPDEDKDLKPKQE